MSPIKKNESVIFSDSLKKHNVFLSKILGSCQGFVEGLTKV